MTAAHCPSKDELVILSSSFEPAPKCLSYTPHDEIRMKGYNASAYLDAFKLLHLLAKTLEHPSFDPHTALCEFAQRSELGANVRQHCRHVEFPAGCAVQQGWGRMQQVENVVCFAPCTTEGNGSVVLSDTRGLRAQRFRKTDDLVLGTSTQPLLSAELHTNNIRVRCALNRT